MDLNSSSSQERRRSGINDRANPSRAKTRAPRGAIIKDRRLQQPFTAHLPNKIHTLASVNNLVSETSAIQRLAREMTRRAIGGRIDRERRGIWGRVHNSSFPLPVTA